MHFNIDRDAFVSYSNFKWIFFRVRNGFAYGRAIWCVSNGTIARNPILGETSNELVNFLLLLLLNLFTDEKGCLNVSLSIAISSADNASNRNGRSYHHRHHHCSWNRQKKNKFIRNTHRHLEGASRTSKANEKKKKICSQLTTRRSFRCWKLLLLLLIQTSDTNFNQK